MEGPYTEEVDYNNPDLYDEDGELLPCYTDDFIEADDFDTGYAQLQRYEFVDDKNKKAVVTGNLLHIENLSHN